MNKISFTIISLTICLNSVAQTKIYSEKEILETQRITTGKIIVSLQNNDIGFILQYFENKSNDLLKKLNISVSEIDKFQSFTRLSDIIVFDEGYHIFRCRYSDKTRARFQIDLYFHRKNANSKVIDIKIKTDQILKKEYKKRMDNTKIPPPKPN